MDEPRPGPKGSAVTENEHHSWQVRVELGNGNFIQASAENGAGKHLEVKVHTAGHGEIFIGQMNPEDFKQFSERVQQHMKDDGWHPKGTR